MFICCGFSHQMTLAAERCHIATLLTWSSMLELFFDFKTTAAVANPQGSTLPRIRFDEK